MRQDDLLLSDLTSTASSLQSSIPARRVDSLSLDYVDHPPREGTHHRCLTQATLIVPVIQMTRHVFKFPLCPCRSPRSMWKTMSCCHLTTPIVLITLASTMMCSLKFPLRLHRTTLILPVIILMPSLRFLLILPSMFMVPPLKWTR